MAKALSKNNFDAMSFHGDKRQTQRSRILKSFKSGKLNFLIATDIAARGIDIKDIMFIINYDLPMQPEIYVHRVGRSARAGKEGIAISMCDQTERFRLKEIEKLIGYKLNLDKDAHSDEEVLNIADKKLSASRPFNKDKKFRNKSHATGGRNNSKIDKENSSDKEFFNKDKKKSNTSRPFNKDKKFRNKSHVTGGRNKPNIDKGNSSDEEFFN